MKRLWYDAPAKVWEEALPLGNGRMGAMVFGKPGREQIQVNEESIWDGRKRTRINPDAKKMLPRIRELILDGQIEEAERLMKWSMSGCPMSMPSYQTLGDIFLDFWNVGEVTDYRRELDLEKAVCSVQYQSEGITYKREVFLSHPADAMIIKCSASKEKALNFDVTLGRVKNTFEAVTKIGDEGICLYGSLGKDGFEYAMSVIACVKEGIVQTVGDHLIIQDATEAVLYFTADCSYHYDEMKASSTRWNVMDDESQSELCEMQKYLQHQIFHKLQALTSESVDNLLAEHIADYQTLFNRVHFTLDRTAEQIQEEETVPTDMRLQTVTLEDDKGLIPLYLDYGRYLMISCSRPGNLPANLQGIWNKELKPSWESKYTININTEMNYWLVESANLPECHLPLFDLIHKMVPNGEQVAREMYGCRGFVAHHNTDIHGDCMVQDRWIPGSYWVMGAAWLCTHMWTHYVYTQDVDSLRENFPIMRKAAEFFLDFLVEKDGKLVTIPSVSPENTFILPNGHQGANIYGVTMDNQILRDLFSQCLKAAKILGVDDDTNRQIAEALDRLFPNQISEKGYLMEWPEDYEELEMGHRHISHLYGLHPSEQITMDGTPELAKAAEVTLERRLANGGGHTGWSRAWIINNYAKLWNGNKAYENIIMLLQCSTYPNLFDCHPPFQIDGNFGGAAGIIEMLVQSSEERVVLLPALPDAWKKGSLTGIRVKGGAEVDVYWEDGNLRKAVLRAEKPCKLSVVYGNNKIMVDIKPKEPKELLMTNFLVNYR